MEWINLKIVENIIFMGSYNLYTHNNLPCSILLIQWTNLFSLVPLF